MRSLMVLTVLIGSLAAAPVAAQEGHPLKGSWLGTMAGNTVHNPDVVLVLDWDGKAITGMINPGTDNIAIRNATLNPQGWVVHFEADAKDAKGQAVTYVFDGRIENLHVPNRGIVGTWKSQRGNGDFKASRQ
ncbi:MAG: hypothetical protein FJW14_13875 [Acidimicrobiia bacterium]|nr:hypothetical protein [Acidimicrobiia bacterium]